MKDFKVYQTSGMLNFLVSEASDVRKKEQTLSGDIVSFPVDEQSPLKIVVDINSTGWTGCEVTRTGKNVLLNNYSDYTIDVAYAFITSLIPHNTPAIMSFTDRDTSVDVSGCYIGFILDHYSADPVTESRWCMSNGNISGVTNNTSAQNPSIFCNGVFIFPNNEETFNKIFSRYYVQVELGPTITDYEPYSGTTLSVTFPDTVGTVTEGTLTIDYNGSVTLNTGGQTYTLTSVSPIETLIGDNNIWADAGPVSVTYPI